MDFAHKLTPKCPVQTSECWFSRNMCLVQVRLALYLQNPFTSSGRWWIFEVFAESESDGNGQISLEHENKEVKMQRVERTQTPSSSFTSTSSVMVYPSLAFRGLSNLLAKFPHCFPSGKLCQPTKFDNLDSSWVVHCFQTFNWFRKIAESLITTAVNSFTLRDVLDNHDWIVIANSLGEMLMTSEAISSSQPSIKASLPTQWISLHLNKIDTSDQVPSLYGMCNQSLIIGWRKN